MIKVYVARAMSGRIKEDVVREARRDKHFLECYGFTILDPVAEEGVAETKEILSASKEMMDNFWKRDKAMIREAHAVIILSPHLGSLGCIREYGYARFFLWKKVVTVFPELPKEGAVCYYEDDMVTDSLQKAAQYILLTHGTRWDRIKWRLNIYKRCWLKAIYYKLQEWK